MCHNETLRRTFHGNEGGGGSSSSSSSPQPHPSYIALSLTVSPYSVSGWAGEWGGRLTHLAMTL